MKKQQDSSNYDIEQYKCLLEQVRHEGNLLWTIYSCFLVLHSLILGYLITNSFIFQKGVPHLFHYRPEIFIPSILGIILCLPWYASFERARNYYRFRMAQARVIEPKGWDIVGGVARDFSHGKTIDLGKEGTYKLSFIAGKIRTNKLALPFFLFCFVVFYVLLSINSGFWWK